MASNNEYEHRGEWDRKCEKLLSDVVRDRKRKAPCFSGTVNIVEGDVYLGFFYHEGKVFNEFESIMLLRDAVLRMVEGYEKKVQAGFVPDGREGYKLPDYQKENEEYARMLNEKYWGVSGSSSAGKVGDGNEG